MRRVWKHGFGSRSGMIIWIGSKNIRWTTRGKGPHVTDSVAVSEIREGKGPSGKKENNKKDSTKTKKTVKDSDVIGIF